MQQLQVPGPLFVICGEEPLGVRGRWLMLPEWFSARDMGLGWRKERAGAMGALRKKPVEQVSQGRVLP